MDETVHTAQTNRFILFVVPAVVIVLLAITIFFFYTAKDAKRVQKGVSSSTQLSLTPTTQQVTQTASHYKDGKYTANGSYLTPAGQEELAVTVTLKNGVIVDSSFVGKATDDQSMRFQQEFGSTYQSMVIGKNIDTVMLTKVAGSSLTPKGFNDALNKIKQDAKG
jgi:uncharacterized protein with FMN-binding domain